MSCTCSQIEGNGPYYECVSGCETCRVCNPPEKQLEDLRDKLKNELSRKRKRTQLLAEIKNLKSQLKSLE